VNCRAKEEHNRGSSTLIRIRPTFTFELLKRLIRIPSVNPAIEGGQGEAEIGAFIADSFRKTRLFRVYEQRVAKDRFNVIAILDGKAEGKSLMLNGHMDTVGTSAMTIKPFHPFVKRGVIHGRGSCDMKGPLAAMISATIAVARSGRRLAGDVVFAGVVDEEYKSLGTSALVKRFRTDAAIVGEPTAMDIATAHKGYAWLEIETIGKRAHGSVPERGIDAIEKMGKIIVGLETLRKDYSLKKHRLLGGATIHASSIEGGSEWSTIPASCVLKLERRLIPGEGPQDAVHELRQIVASCSRGDKKLKARVRLIHRAESMEIKKAVHIDLLRENVRRFGGRGHIVGVPYWTDASILVNEARIPSCLFGPGNIAVAHSPDEYIAQNDVLAAAHIYANTAYAYCDSH
jgi:acetylornithine deacetylase